MLKKLVIPVLGLGVILTTFVWFTARTEFPINRAPEISFTTLSGQQINLGELRGRPVLISFWSTSCRVCIEEMPGLFALYENNQNQGLEIIAIAMRSDPPSAVLEMAKHKSIPYPVVVDLMGEHAQAFGGVNLTPTTFLIGPDGQVISYQQGKYHPEKLQELVTSLLQNTQRKAG